VNVGLLVFFLLLRIHVVVHFDVDAVVFVAEGVVGVVVDRVVGMLLLMLMLCLLRFRSNNVVVAVENVVSCIRVC